MQRKGIWMVHTRGWYWQSIPTSIATWISRDCLVGRLGDLANLSFSLQLILPCLHQDKLQYKLSDKGWPELVSRSDRVTLLTLPCDELESACPVCRSYMRDYRVSSDRCCHFLKKQKPQYLYAVSQLLNTV